MAAFFLQEEDLHLYEGREEAGHPQRFAFFAQNYDELLQDHVKSGADITLLYHKVFDAKEGYTTCNALTLDGDKVTGITFMKMDVGMDTGDIIDKIEVAIDPDEHTESLMNRLAEASAEKLPEIIDSWVEGKLETVKQDDSLATACPPIRPEEGEFTWDQDASDIHNRVRALSAWPGAFVMSGENKLKVLDSTVVSDDDRLIPEELKDAQPGVVVRAKGENLIVKCGKGFLKIKELQQPGGKRLNARDCAHNFTVGKQIM